HEEKGAMMTIALFKVENVKNYGVAELGPDMRIKRFVEKPPPDKAPSNYINAGIYLLSPEIRREVEGEEVMKMREERGRLDFGYDFIPYLVDKGIPVYGYELKVWYDLGTPESYLKAMKDILYGALDIRVTEERLFRDKNIWVQGYSKESMKIREDILRKCRENKLSIEGADLIGRHTRIGDYTKILDSNIDNFCIIGEKVNIEGSAIMDAAKIGDCAQISNSVIGRKVMIESNCQSPTYIESTSVIGNAVHVKEGCRLVRTRVDPGLTVPPQMKYIDKFLQSYEDVVHLAEPTS
ncbi:MAG: NDP-sugar synthase, partial [archaeon]|nr:NDP-sugar synthase [archaeon]